MFRFNHATNQPCSVKDALECAVTTDVADIFSGRERAEAIRAHEEFFLHADDVYDDGFSLCEAVFQGAMGQSVQGSHYLGFVEFFFSKYSCALSLCE